MSMSTKSPKQVIMPCGNHCRSIQKNCNMGKTIINHPQITKRNRCCKPFPKGQWVIYGIVLPTSEHFWEPAFAPPPPLPPPLPPLPRSDRPLDLKGHGQLTNERSKSEWRMLNGKSMAMHLDCEWMLNVCKFAMLKMQ